MSKAVLYIPQSIKIKGLKGLFKNWKLTFEHIEKLDKS